MSRCSVAAPRRAQGFTFIWVLIAVALMGLGLTVITEVDSTTVQRDREVELLSIGRQFRFAIESYVAASGGPGPTSYPASLDELLHDPRAPGVRRHLRKLFVDPMTGKAEWGTLVVAGRIVGIHSLSERTPIKQDGFEAEDAAFRGKPRYADWVFTYPAGVVAQAEPGGVNPAQSKDILMRTTP